MRGAAAQAERYSNFRSPPHGMYGVISNYDAPVYPVHPPPNASSLGSLPLHVSLLKLGCSRMVLKLAIVGGGPSAFFVASRLQKLLPTSNFRIHVFDRLWSPHGLVRYGVAPDHPEVKVSDVRFISGDFGLTRNARTARTYSTRLQRILGFDFSEMSMLGTA